MAMRRSHNLHTIYKAEVIEHPYSVPYNNIRNEQTLHGHNIPIL